jgi:hypothetical protein
MTGIPGIPPVWGADKCCTGCAAAGPAQKPIPATTAANIKAEKNFMLTMVRMNRKPIPHFDRRHPPVLTTGNHGDFWSDCLFRPTLMQMAV